MQTGAPTFVRQQEVLFHVTCQRETSHTFQPDATTRRKPLLVGCRFKGLKAPTGFKLQRCIVRELRTSCAIQLHVWWRFVSYYLLGINQ